MQREDRQNHLWAKLLECLVRDGKMILPKNGSRRAFFPKFQKLSDPLCPLAKQVVPRRHSTCEAKPENSRFV